MELSPVSLESASPSSLSAESEAIGWPGDESVRLSRRRPWFDSHFGTVCEYNDQNIKENVFP